MTTTLYPLLLEEEQLMDVVREIVRLRDSDVSDFTNLNQRFVSGRGLFTTRAAPADANDVLATDQEGDIVNDSTYEYKLLLIGSDLKWDRRTLDTSW